MYSLIDCNNFFVSCERAFAPSLVNMPVAVLSSNDGCVISRSNEAKALGVPMGAPYFQFRDFFREKGVQIFSSNFALYADMSRRVMSILEGFSDDVEIYSIDEAFLRVPPNVSPFEWGSAVREAILRSTGIPVSVGIARTKTLSKIAGHIAKEEGKRGGIGVFDYEAAIGKEAILASLTAGEVWGIGGNTARKLLSANIKTAFDFAQAPDRWIQKNLGIGGMKIALELRGIPALLGSYSHDVKQSIRSTRSFGKPVLELVHLERSIAVHAARAALKMRREGSAASFVSVFVGTGKHGDDARYYNSSSQGFELPTTDTCEIITIAKEALRDIYRRGYRYKRSGVMLGGFIPERFVPIQSLFGETGAGKRQELMHIVDRINDRYGSNTLRSAAALPEASSAPRSDFVSPRYTTEWKDLLKVVL